ncbi:MAG: TraM recognition domain-containing protein [Saprospiraceae bacterium]|nr:TraM recognition domain-containing protein [Saprospiraceae bacterium]
MDEYLNKIIAEFPKGSKDVWTVDDAMKGVSILGGTGSGKTSASGRALALKYLEEGWGGVVLCAKTDEAELWKKYCEEKGRTNDLIVFEKGAAHKEGAFAGQLMVFNPIDYELKRPGEGAGETQNITNIFMNIYRMGNRVAGEGEGGGKEERFWDMALKRCLNRVIELLKLADKPLSFKNMVQVLSSCANVNSEIFAQEIASERSAESQDDENFCLKCLIDAYQKVQRKFEDDAVDAVETESAFEMVYRYFTSDFNALGDKTRSTVTESFMGLAEPFLAGLLSKHFAGETNVFPEWSFDDDPRKGRPESKKIFILNFSVKEFLDMGIIAQCVFKLMFQQAAERRDVGKHPIPVFLWADEVQLFVNPYDQIFLTTARSKRVATVFLTQNISNYLAVMGAGMESKAKVDSLLGNLSTKIFHANMDAETNEYASRLIGNALLPAGSESRQISKFRPDDNRSVGEAMVIQPQVFPREFTVLKSGGKENDFKVEAIMLVANRLWSNNTNYRLVTFTQSFAK